MTSDAGVIWRAIRHIYVGRPRPGWIVGLAAYFDDSMEHWPERDPTNSYYTIAGYLAPIEMWEGVFVPNWRAFLDAAPHEIEEYKASSVRGKTGEFAGWTDKEIADYGKLGVQTLAKAEHAPMMSVASVVVLPFGQYGWPQRHLESLAIVTGLAEVVRTMCRFAHDFGMYEDIHFLCDARTDQERIGRAWRSSIQKLRDNYGKHLSYLDFEDSKDMRPLQAADLIAYEARKDAKDRLVRPDSPRSRGLSILINSHPHIGYYWDSDILNEYA